MGVMSLYSIKSVMLVDDDEATVFLTKVFIDLLELDIPVHTAVNGREALEFLEEQSIRLKDANSFTPCLLVLDITMPVMNGWQFLDAYVNRFSEELKEKIVIVMITVSEDERDIIRAVNNPVVKEYLQKPLSDKKLLELLEKYFKKPCPGKAKDQDGSQ